MKKLLFFLFVALLTYAIALLVQAPLPILLSYLPKNLPIQIQGAQGQLLDGTLYQVRYPRYPVVNQLSWSIRPKKLLEGQLMAQTEAETLDGKITGLCGVDWTLALQCEDLSINLPAAAIKKIPHPALNNAPSLAGTIDAYFSKASWTRQGLPELSGHANWNQAALTSPFSMALGQQYRADIRSDANKTLIAQLSSTESQLDINDSEITLNNAGQYQADIYVKPLSNGNNSIRSALPMLLGDADASGHFQRQFQGTIPLP